MAALGDERLFELRDQRRRDRARGRGRSLGARPSSWSAGRRRSRRHGDERETGARIRLNLGHSIGHAGGGRGTSSSTGGGRVGLRAAFRIGRLGVTHRPPASALLKVLLGAGPPYPPRRSGLAADKKHAGGRLRWVLPTADGVEVRSDVPDDVVASVLDGLLAGAHLRAGAER